VHDRNGTAVEFVGARDCSSSLVSAHWEGGTLFPGIDIESEWLKEIVSLPTLPLCRLSSMEW